jgi:hypothetical protein
VISARLETGLRAVAAFMNDADKPWWIIGSAALVLSGVQGVEPDDIDIVCDGKSLFWLLESSGIKVYPPSPHKQFRSSPYQRIQVANGTPIELMGDLQVHDGTAFRALKISSRETVRAAGTTFYLPSIAEQIAILRLFGRSKDLAKAALLEELIRPRHNAPSGAR